MKLQETIRTPEGDLLYEESEILKKSQKFKNRKFTFKKWDMYWAGVRFTDDPRFFKIRPIILLKEKGNNLFDILWCTSVFGVGKYPIKNYLNLGLIKPSYIVKKPESINLEFILDPLKNSLSKEDIKNITLKGFV